MTEAGSKDKVLTAELDAGSNEDVWTAADGR
jgi:hypothetical protein